MRPYRDPNDPRRVTWARSLDFGPCGHWWFVVHVVLGIARYVCVPDDLRIGLGSIPVQPLKEDSPHPLPTGQACSGGDARADEDFYIPDRFLLPPFLAVLMMEESMGFVWLGDRSVVESETIEPEGSDFAGKKGWPCASAE